MVTLGLPRINVRMPVIVADGILGSFSWPPLPSFPLLVALSLRVCDEYHGLALMAAACLLVVTNKERKAVKETIDMATQTSICCQKKIQV